MPTASKWFVWLLVGGLLITTIAFGFLYFTKSGKCDIEKLCPVCDGKKCAPCKCPPNDCSKCPSSSCSGDLDPFNSFIAPAQGGFYLTKNLESQGTCQSPDKCPCSVINTSQAPYAGIDMTVASLVREKCLQDPHCVGVQHDANWDGGDAWNHPIQCPSDMFSPGYLYPSDPKSAAGQAFYAVKCRTKS